VHIGTAVAIDHGIRSKRLVAVSEVAWLVNVSPLVNKIESVVAVVGLWFDLLIAGEDEEGDNDYRDAETHNDPSSQPIGTAG
jgi:hypothetical protein